MKGLMIDLETLSLRPTAAIIQIGAVVFDTDTGKLNKGFEINLKEKARSTNQHVDKDTLEWWTKVDPERAAMYEKIQKTGVKKLKLALDPFVEWCKKQRFSSVWANGAAYDIPIIEHALKSTGTEVPWSYRQIRDMRTLKVLFDPEECCGVDPVKPHDALSDARAQAEYVVKLYENAQAMKLLV